MKILIAEDDFSNLKLVGAIVKSSGWETLEARDGQQAWDMIDDDEIQVDLLLTDYMMPKMDGLELLKKVRDKYPLLPVIMITAIDERDVIRTALKSGANDFLDKPLRRVELIAAIESVIKEDRHQLLRETLATSMAVQAAQDRLLTNSGFYDVLPSDYAALHYQTFTAAGGDFIYCSSLGKDKFRIVIADVAGHDVSSSYMAAELKGILNAISDKYSKPVDYLKNLNKNLNSARIPQTHACITIVDWDMGLGYVQIINAGLPHGTLLNNSQDRITLQTDGMMLGLFDDIVFDQLSFYLHANEKLLFYTDGIEDSTDLDGVLQYWQDAFDQPINKTMVAFVDDKLKSINAKDDILMLALSQPKVAVEDDKQGAEFCTLCHSSLSLIVPLIKKVTNFLSSHLRDLQFDKDMYSYCLIELVSNAILYGNREKIDRIVVIEVKIIPELEQIYTLVKDEGTGFDLASTLTYEEKELDNLPTRGRGLIGVSRIAKQLAVSGNRVTFSFPCSAME